MQTVPAGGMLTSRTNAAFTEPRVPSIMNEIKSLTVLLLALAITSCGQAPSADNSRAESIASASGQESEAQVAGSSKPKPDGVKVVNRGSSASVAQYLCSQSDSGCKSDGDPFVASSEDEARWLSQHGYPSKEEFARLRLLTPSQLEAEAVSGNGAAAVMHAKKVGMQPGRFSEGVLKLHEQAVSGNLYAYYGLSELYWRNVDNKNLVDSAAYLRVAYLLGDWKAADQLARFNLPQAEMVAADRRAASLLSSFSGGMEPSRRPMQ